MTQEGSEASVGSSSLTPNWWDIHTNLNNSAWNSWHHQPQSNSSCEDQAVSLSTNSFTKSMDSEQSENHLWSQVLFGTIGDGAGDVHTNHDVNSENFLEALSSKGLATDQMFNPACDYLNHLDKHINGYNNNGTTIEPKRPSTLSDLVSNWSIAPPNTTSYVNAPLNPTMTDYIKNELGYFPSYLHEIKGESKQLHDQHHIETTEPFINRYYNEPPWPTVRNLSDLISFDSCLNEAEMEYRTSNKPSVNRSESSSESKKQEHGTSSSTIGSGRSSGTATSEGRKKRSEDSSETPLKKSKHSNVSSAKLQAPKVKLGEKITALQQLVSPFGKTDTASVLLEAINTVRILQDQVQMLSDPYLKSSANKESPWGGLEKRDKAEMNLDLRSRGLCIVPISCTPQVLSRKFWARLLDADLQRISVQMICLSSLCSTSRFLYSRICIMWKKLVR